MAVRGHSVLDFISRTYRNNRALLKEKKPLKTIYNENNFHYIRKRVQKRAETYDPDKRKVFLEKFYARQKRTQRRLITLLVLVILIFSLISYFVFNVIF